MSDIPSSSRPPELLIRTPDGGSRTVSLDRGRFSLGRTNANDLVYANVPGLSREHLAFERDGTDWTVRDLGSTNGTFVNGKKITEPTPLRPKDQVTVGQLTITFTRAAPAGSQTVVFVEKLPSSTASQTTMRASLDGVLSQESGGKDSGHIGALIRAGRELAGHMPLDKLFELILNLSVDAVGAARGVLMTLEDGELFARASKGAGFRISSHVRDVVINQKQSLLVRDAMMDQALAARQSIVVDQVRSMLAVPLQTETGVIGLIYLDSPGFIHEFTKDDLNLLTVMANIAAVRIENARLIEIEQAERVRAKELEHAAMIQRSILPRNFPPFPDRRDFALHAAMTPAKEVGGDLFDFFLLDRNHLGFVIGDVSGKGAPAALFMAVARTLLKATAQYQPSPGACLTKMNDALASDNVSGMFVSVFYGVLNTDSGEMQFANAGHNPPYIVSPAGEWRKVDGKSGPIVGVMEGMEYRTIEGRLAPDEAILLYTDGVTEALNKSGEFFDEARLEGYLAGHAAEPVEQLVRGLHEVLQKFAAGTPQSDDITALALRYIG